MALDFPPNSTDPNPPQNGDEWKDDCGNNWVYDSTDNKWTIDPPEFDFPDVDPDSIWARTAGGEITPINADDVLNMGTQNSDINLEDFQEAT